MSGRLIGREAEWCAAHFFATEPSPGGRGFRSPTLQNNVLHPAACYTAAIETSPNPQAMRPKLPLGLPAVLTLAGALRLIPLWAVLDQRRQPADWGREQLRRGRAGAGAGRRHPRPLAVDPPARLHRVCRRPVSLRQRQPGRAATCPNRRLPADHRRNLRPGPDLFYFSQIYTINP